jgi:hypothetical protein
MMSGASGVFAILLARLIVVAAVTSPSTRMRLCGVRLLLRK